MTTEDNATTPTEESEIEQMRAQLRRLSDHVFTLTVRLEALDAEVELLQTARSVAP